MQQIQLSEQTFTKIHRELVRNMMKGDLLPSYIINVSLDSDILTADEVKELRRAVFGKIKETDDTEFVATNEHGCRFIVKVNCKRGSAFLITLGQDDYLELYDKLYEEQGLYISENLSIPEIKEMLTEFLGAKNVQLKIEY